MRSYSKEEIETFRERAHRLIPSGAHTYSKTDEQFSSNAPAFIQSAKGAICNGIDGFPYVDYGMGLFSVSLGHAYPDVISEITNRLKDGNSYTRPSLLEGELAEQLCDLIPSAEMVKFAKNGSDVTSAAVRLARAFTKRDYVITIKEQPFHSFNDWFIGSTSKAEGVPSNIRELTLKIPYNDITILEQLIESYTDQVACILMEPVTFTPPTKDYLKKIRALCTQHNIVLIFDEIITGFRWDIKGAQHYFDVIPDLSTFGKGMANGFACAALVGKKEIMQLGNFDEDLFLLSCTFGSELVGLTAALKTIEIFQKENVIESIWNYGEKLLEGFNQQIKEYKLEDFIRFKGYACRPSLTFLDSNDNFSFELKTLFIQEMIKRKILMERVCISYSHDSNLLDSTLNASNETFKVIQKALHSDLASFIEGPLVKPVFTMH